MMSDHQNRFVVSAKARLGNGAVILALLSVAGVGIWLFSYSLPRKIFTEELLIWDCIRLDFWALLFWFALIVLWCSRLSGKARSFLMITCLSLYGLVAVSLILDGTPFSINGYWGDQRFRTAMVMRYMNSFWPADMYYQGLPTFYPPLYYFLLSIWARIFSLEAFKMLKIGSQLIYALWPFMLFFLWRRLVTPLQAFMITLFTFLFCSIGKVPTLVAPHAFVGNSLFVPWWLHFVEGIGRRKPDWRYIVAGGIIGTAIFLTYYYALFVGGLLLVLRLVLARRWTFIQWAGRWHWRACGMVLVGTAVVSAVYWLPLLISALTNGYGPAQQRYHHLSSTGILFSYMVFTFPGILFLGGIVYALRRSRTPINRGLLLLTGATSVFYLLGTLLGMIDRPVNLIKAYEFVIYLAGPFVGLALAGLLTWARKAKRYRYVIPVLASIAVIFFLHNFNAVAKGEMVRTARTATVPSWNLDKAKMPAIRGTVFLTPYDEFYAFYPVYAFIANNEHYSHPASRIKQRFDFLDLLQGVEDPTIFHIALRHNIFDAVDYFMPRLKNGNLEMRVYLSNYPNKYARKDLRFDTNVVSDTLLFAKEQGDCLYRVKDVPSRFDSIREVALPLDLKDSLTYLARIQMLRYYLDPVGRGLLDGYLQSHYEEWQQPIPNTLPHRFDDSISLRAVYLVTSADSLRFVFGFKALQNIAVDYRIFLHITVAGEEGRFRNFDFSPFVPTSKWTKGDLVFCVRTIPSPGQPFSYLVGPFRGRHRLGRGYQGQYLVTEADTH